jgi:hypothetical protein
MAFPNLPGVIINSVDGGLAARRQPKAHSTLIIGTSDKGPADQPTQVTDRAAAALQFGTGGHLVRLMEEVASSGSDNIVLFRMGTKPQTLSNVGVEFAASKTITNVARAITGLVTITATAHGFTTGATVKVAAVTNASVNGTFVITVVDANSFTYQTTNLTLITAGADTGTASLQTSAGFSIAFSERTADANTRYVIWYKAGDLAVWLDGNLVWSNDSGLGNVDTGDLTITGTVVGNIGLQLGSGTQPTFATGITAQAASVLAGTVTDPAPVLVTCNTGLSLTGRQAFVGLRKALDLLDGFQAEQIICSNPLCILDGPNVSLYVSGDSTTAINNPATNPDSLDWLKTTTDAVGNKTYQWASDTVDSNGTTVTAMSAVTAATRLAAGFFEVSWAYELAKFANKVSKLNTTCIAFIGTSGPKTLKLADVRTWIGAPTKVDSTGKPTAAGIGLLGNWLTMGTTAAKLNSLTIDQASGARKPGIFETAEGEFDGTIDQDKNGNPIDIGAYLHICADLGVQTNGWGRNYASNIVGRVAGLCAVLDEKSGLTNKPLGVTQIPGLVYTPTQLDALAGASINVLERLGFNQAAVLLHDFTAATSVSDFSNLVRQRVKGLWVKTLLVRARTFVGESTNDGLQLQALKTALDADIVSLQERGYGSKGQVIISNTDAEARLGHVNLDLTFRPPDELIQINASIGFTF